MIKNTLALLVLSSFFSVSSSAQNEPPSPSCTPDNSHRVVIIIDDIGHNLGRGRDALSLPGKLNFAVIPHTRYGAQLAEAAHRNGKEVMLHAPMSTLEGTALGEGGLTPELDHETFRQTLRTSLDAVPHVKGINNHMGSDLTQRRRQMAWLMQELRWQDLYFVDSRTSDKTVAATVAAEFNVPHLSRKVFLDNERTRDAIAARYEELLAAAREDGLAVAIGHPYPETIAYLQEALPLLHDHGMKLALVSEVVQARIADVTVELPPTSQDAIGTAATEQAATEKGENAQTSGQTDC